MWSRGYHGCGMDLGNERGPIVAVTGTRLGTGMPASGQIGISLPIRRTLNPGCLRCLLTHMSALRELLATGTTSHDASKPICHFCLSLEACWGLRIAQNV